MGSRTSNSPSRSWKTDALAWLGRGRDAVGARLASCLPEDGSLRRWSDRIAVILLAVGVLVAAFVGVPSLIERADAGEAPISREPAASLAGPAIRFIDEPAWLDPSERERIEISIAAELAGASAFDRASLESAAAAAERTGWFDGTVTLLRTGLNEVLVETPLRVPRAAVRSRGRDHLVDLRGTLLPMSWIAGRTPFAIPVFVGVRESAPDRPGTTWPGGTVTIGFEVLEAISRRPWSGSIRAIDLDGVERGAPIRLQTVGGGTIVWGGTAATSVAEVPVATRLAYLDRLHQRTGSIDPPPGKAWDLRLDYLASRPEPGSSASTLASAVELGDSAADHGASGTNLASRAGRP